MASVATYSSLVLKGTRHGLLASIREDADWPHVLAELARLSQDHPGFLTDASITFDFGWREVTEEQFDQVITSLHSQGLSCNGILSTSLNTRTIAEERGYRAIIGRLGLAKHQGRRMRQEKEEVAPAPQASTPTPEVIEQPAAPAEVAPQAPASQIEESVEDSFDAIPAAQEESVETSIEPSTSPSQEGVHVPRFDDEEPTLYLRKTLRSGQKVVFAGNVVLLGDLNPGAAIEADGDIIVMGQLRGTVHAGAEGDLTSTIITSSLRPTQLRIADRFWQGERNQSFFKKSPLSGTLKARLDGDSVVVEALPAR